MLGLRNDNFLSHSCILVSWYLHTFILAYLHTWILAYRWFLLHLNQTWSGWGLALLKKCLNIVSLDNIDSILVEGACASPKLRWESPQDLWLWNFDNHPIFKIAILRREIVLVQSAAQKWSSLQKMIVLKCWSFWQEMSNFYFSLKKDPKGGPLDDFFKFFAALDPTIFLVF